MNYDVVIGIEIHVELKTKTKMFSASLSDFGKKANSQVNEIDIALPGTLPCVNQEAVKKALQVCMAHNLEIDPLIKFDRKNYYYSDLPKGYQITQQFHPIGKNGFLVIRPNGQEKKIRINRIHMEEDTAKQFHLHDETLIDFNRAGVPLIEIVSEPDMESGLEASLYVEKLRQNILYLGASDCKMEEGSMRCDVNISLKPKGSKKFGSKVEIKNLNSINNVKLAIDYEIKRQSKILDDGQEVIQCTRRFDEKSLETVLMRKKEGVVDYKFFPEPNIFPIKISDEFLNDVRKNLVELPDDKFIRYQKTYSLNEYDINLLINNMDLSRYFDSIMLKTSNAKLVCNLLNSELLGLMSKNNLDFENLKITTDNFAQLVLLLEKDEISSKQAKEILELMLEGQSPNEIVKQKGYKQVSNEEEIKKFVLEVLNEQSQSIADYKNGKDRALGFLVGQLMKKTKGQANPSLASKIMKEELDKI